MKLKNVFELINAQHELTIKYQDYDDDDDVMVYQETVYTCLYGNPTSRINDNLLEREIHALYPAKDVLVIMLKDEVPIPTMVVTKKAKKIKVDEFEEEK